MKETGKPDELDLALLNAMQISPRVRWKDVGEILGVSPVTVARRWEQLNAAQLAWVTVCGSPQLMTKMCFALVAVSCAPDRVDEVANVLLGDPHAVTIAHTAGRYDLLVSTWTADMAMLSHYILDRVSQVPGVASIRASVASEVFTDGSRWRLHALSPQQQQMVRETLPSRAVTADFRPEDRPLLVALSRDGRASYDQLGAAVGMSSASARRRVARIIGNGGLSLRCEVSRAISGMPVEVTLWIEVPVGRVAECAARVTGLAQMRLCAALVEKSNVVLVLWLRSVAELQALELEIARTSPIVRVVERTLTLRHLKLIGRVLNGDGKGVLAVPADVWQEPTAAH